MNQKYDYIIAGAGLAGLTLATQLIESRVFEKKRILLIDQERKKGHDRTWSYWSQKEDPYQSIYAQEWSHAQVRLGKQMLSLDLSPYTYRSINSPDFYQWAFHRIESTPYIDWCQESITSIDSAKGIVKTVNHQFHGDLVFDSTYQREDFQIPKDRLLLWQHFKGWVIESKKADFDTDQVILMDFDVDRYGETRFFYLLPYSNRKAMVEYTIFSSKMLNETEYDTFLHEYIANQLDTDYKVLSTEFGAIPMTDHSFPSRRGKVIYIGTKGGFVKASSGYAFQYTQRKIEVIINQLKQGKSIDQIDHQSPKKYRFYDRILLHIINQSNISSAKVFFSMYQKLPIQLLFKFLDEQSNFWEDLQVINSVPLQYKWSFTRKLPLWKGA